MEDGLRYNRFDQPCNGICSYAKKPICNNLEELKADFAIVGIPFELGNNCRAGAKMAPRSIREASTLYGDEGNPCYDFENDCHYLADIVDCGDIDVISGDVMRSLAIIEHAIDQILAQGAVPIGIGGDDTIPIPFAKSLLKAKKSFCMVQIDAHLDWTDNRAGQKYCQSTNMRRIAEMPGVAGMAQVALRGIGSSRKEDFDAAREFGTVLISAREFQQMGPAEVLQRIPQHDHYYINLDIDGMDPSIAPGTTTPAPGGLLYNEVKDLFDGLSKKGEIIGMTVAEVCPPYDAGTTTSFLAARMILDVILFASREKALKK